MRRLMMLSAALFLAMPAVAQAQLGIKGGVLWSDVDNSGALPGDLEGRTGFTIGLSLDAGKEPVGLGIEALYARRGLDGSTPADTRRLDYIDVPAYLRLAIPGNDLQLFGYIGPQISFEITCVTGDDNGDCPDDEGRKSTTFSGIIGAGLRFGNRSAFSIEARYMYGLTDLRVETVTDSDSYKDRAFMLLGGISF